MTVLIERAKDVFAPTDSGGNARGMDMGQARRWGILQERMAVYGAVSAPTKTDLDNIVPVAGTYPGGLVLGGAEAGFYAWGGADWGTKIRGFPDTAALLTNVAGTANAITAETQTGVDPGDVQLFILPDPPGTNTSPDMSLRVNEGASNAATFAIKAASGAAVANGDVIDGVGTIFFRVSDTEIRQLVSSQTGATLDIQGEWNSGTNYVQSQIVIKSNKWFFLTTASSQNEDPDAGAPWLQVLDVGSVSTDVLTNYSVSPGNDAATNDASVATLETALAKAIVDGRGREIPVTTPPTGNQYKNTVWQVPNFDGTMTAGVPSDPDTLPVASTLVRASGAEDGWPQCGCKHPAGSNRVVRVNTVKRAHGNAPTSIVMQQGVIKNNRTDWFETVTLKGPGDKLDETDGGETASEFGFDAYSFWMIGDAVAFIAAAKKYDGNSVSWHLLRRHLGKIYALTTAQIETQAASEDIRIYFSDLDFSAWEGMEDIDLSGAPVFNGINVNGSWKIQQRTSTYAVLRRMTLNGDVADVTAKGSGVQGIRIRIKATGLEELKFPGGENLGEAFVTFTPPSIPAAPSLWHGGHQITTAGNGQAIIGVTGGAPSPGHAVIQALLDSEASFLAVVKYEDADVTTDHTEPAPIVHSSGKVATVLRTNDEAVPSLFCVAADIYSQPVCTPLPFAGTAEESPWFPEFVDTPDGERIFFGFSGDRTPVAGSYGVRSQIPMFLMTALWSDVSDGSVGGFKQIKAFDADWSGELSNQAALFQMGGLCYIPRLNALLTQYSEAYSTGSGEYASNMNTLLIGLDHWNPVIRREPLRAGRAPGVGKWRITYLQLSGALNEGDYFNPQNVRYDAVSRNYDPATGFFFTDLDQEVTWESTPFYDEGLSGAGIEHWLELVDKNDVRHPDTGRIAYFRTDSGLARPISFQPVTVFQFAGEEWRLKLFGTGAKIQAGVDRNWLTIRGGS